ncbi:MAG: DUF1697 domain-containing protein [Streptosporangiaceae bacterium]
MASHVALLRGINLGGRNKIAMADLRKAVTSLGHTGVTTYIQSGNVLFTAAGVGAGGVGAGNAELAAELESAILDGFGVASPVVVLTRDELAQVLRDNPYQDEPDPRLVHVVFLSAEPTQERLDKIAAAQSAAAAKGSRDSVRAIGRALFLHTPDGFGRSELAQVLLRIAADPGKTSVAATARNWATATKLLSLCEEG